MQKIPLIAWTLRHPRVSGWFVLSLGMVALLFVEARDIGLSPIQWLSLMVATVLIAGLCVWIISWDDDSDSELRTTQEIPPVVISTNATPTQPDSVAKPEEQPTL